MLSFHSIMIPFLMHMCFVLCVLCRKGTETINCRCLHWNVKVWKESTTIWSPEDEAFCLRVGKMKERCGEGLKANRGKSGTGLSNCFYKAGILYHNEVMPLLVNVGVCENMKSTISAPQWTSCLLQMRRKRKLVSSCWQHHQYLFWTHYFICCAQKSQVCKH